MLNLTAKKSCLNYSKYYDLTKADFKIHNICCDKLKKEPIKKIKGNSLVGTLAEESQFRRNSWLKNGCNSFDGKNPKSTPLATWTNQDILKYIHDNKLPIASVYGDVYLDLDWKYKTTKAERTGCIFCPFGAHLEKNHKRFISLAETHPQLYRYCIEGGEHVDGRWQPSDKGLGLGYVFDWCNENIPNFKIDYKE